MKLLPFLFLPTILAAATVEQREVRSILAEDQFALIEKVSAFSQSRDYASVYSLIANDYRAVVKKEVFIRVCSETGWRLTKASLGRVDIIGDFGYAPIEATIVIGRIEHRVDTVLFFVKEDGRWVFSNFPFMGSHIAAFPGFPPWLLLASGLNAK